jgi:PAS domain-containing protein
LRRLPDFQAVLASWSSVALRQEAFRVKRILKTPVHRSSILSALTGSVCRRVALVVFAAVIVLDAIVMIPVYLTEKEDFLVERALEARSLFTAGVDASRYPSIDTLVEVGENLVRNTKVEGGVLISGAGEDRAVFGAVPSLTWAEARLDGKLVLFDSDDGKFDIFISPEETQLPYGLILRLDVAEDWAKLTGHITEQLVLALVVAIVLSILTSLIVANQVVRPLGTIRKTIDVALNAPEEAGSIHTGVSRNDEIGVLAQAVDQLLFLTSTTFSDDLAAAVTILETAQHGILTFSEQGHLISANKAALSLFGESRFEDLLNRDPTSLFRFGDETVDCNEFAGRGRVLGPGEILRDSGEDFPCLVAGDTVMRADGSVLRRFLIFVDMRALVEQVRSEVHRRETAEREVKKLASDLRLMRRMFDACLVITELGAAGDKRKRSVTLQPRGLVDAWMERLATVGEPPPDHVDIGELPPVIGDPAELRQLFDTALEVVRLRSSSPNPRISITGASSGSDVTVVIRECDEKNADLTISKDVDVALLFGALGVLCRRQDGSIVATTGQEDGNRLAFRLKIDLTVADSVAAESEAA